MKQTIKVQYKTFILETEPDCGFTISVMEGPPKGQVLIPELTITVASREEAFNTLLQASITEVMRIVNTAFQVSEITIQ